MFIGIKENVYIGSIYCFNFQNFFLRALVTFSRTKIKILDRILIKSIADLNNHLVFQEQLKAMKVSFQLAYL